MLAAALATGFASCVRVDVDLRPNTDNEHTGDADVTCAPGERVDPQTGACAPCLFREAPEAVCPCGFTYSPAAFPYCDAPQAYHECEPCPVGGSINDCQTRLDDGSIRDCALLYVCCQELRQGPNPCCPTDQALLCYSDDDAGSGGFAYRCLDASCCESPCTSPADCAAFQTCVQGSCTPGCHPDTEYCNRNCTCTVQAAPPL